MTKLWNKIDAKRKLSKAIVFALSLVCAGALTNVPVFADAQVGTWYELEAALKNGGKIILQSDISANSGNKTLEVNKADVTLDLNGYTINGNAIVDSVIKVSDGKTLTLTDDSGAQQPGKITGGNAWAGGGVYVNGGTFTMNGGTITDNDATNSGGGVYVKDGTFTMNGGTITDNDATTSGGGVYVNGGTFTMTEDSVISHNSSKDGGGVYIANAGTYMSGNSQIKNNNASESCGGVYIYDSRFSISENSQIKENSAETYGGVGIMYNATLTMTDGSICNNTALKYGGVYLYSGTFTLGGTAVITGNTADSKPYNVGLAINKSITLDNPSNGMSVGVTMQTPGVFTANAADGYLDYFSSDDRTYTVAYDSDKKLKLAAIPASKVITAPEALSLKYNGKEQELVSAGVAEDGTMNYVLGGSSMPTEGWSASIPTMKNAGSYTVWYKSVGDSEHTDSEPACVDVTMYPGDHSVTAPTALNLAYNGKDQVLISAGSCETGTILYSLDGETWSPKADAITAKEVGSYTIYYMVKEDGNFNKYGPEQITATIVKKSEPKPLPFKDVAKDKWYYDAVDFVYQNGIMVGKDTNTFDPTADITRQEFVTILYNYMGKPEVSGEFKQFKDVPANAWFAKPVQWGYENKVLNGKSDTEFGLGDVTRQEAAKFMYNFAVSQKITLEKKADLATFKDAAKIGKWAKDSVSYMAGYEVMKGKGNGKFDPTAKCSRGEAAQLIKNFIETFRKDS